MRDGAGGLEVGGAAGHPLTGAGVGGVEVGGAAGPPLTGTGVGGLEVGGAAGPPLTGTSVGGVEVGGVDVLDRFPPVGPSLGPVDSAEWSVRGLQGYRFRALILCMLAYKTSEDTGTYITGLIIPSDLTSPYHPPTPPSQMCLFPSQSPVGRLSTDPFPMYSTCACIS